MAFLLQSCCEQVVGWYGESPRASATIASLSCLVLVSIVCNIILLRRPLRQKPKALSTSGVIGATAEPSGVPAWLTRGCPTAEPDARMLEASRKEMYQALTLFYGHVRYVLTLILSIPLATFIILALARRDGTTIFEPGFLRWIAGGVLAIVVPAIAMPSIVVIFRYYEVYVSALLFATRLHLRARTLAGEHPWFQRAIGHASEPVQDSLAFRLLSKLSGGSRGDEQRFIVKRASTSWYSFWLYASIIMILGVANFVVGILIWLQRVT